MIKKIYAVELSYIDEWDEVDDMTSETSPVVAIDGVEWPAVVTTDHVKAHDFFCAYSSELVEGEYLTIEERIIEVSDETWKKLEEKEKLEYPDYQHLLTDSTVYVNSWAYVYNNHSDSYDSVLDEVTD